MASKNKTTSRYPKPLQGIRNKDLYNKDNYYEGFNASEFSRKMAERAYANSKGLAGQQFAATPASFEEQVIPWGSPAAQLGQSRYDDKVVFGGIDNQRVQDDRAANQPWYAQLGAGIAKGVITAGTTFLDGTVGLLVGAGSAIANKSWGKLFNNDFSQAMRLFTNAMEEELPNYRSVDEQENPMAWRNLFTMNTFADDFLKNLGFTVGAFYSGNAFLGALKAIPKIGTAMSKVAMETIGSVVSGFNEGRIEAGNLYDETVKQETQKLTEANQIANDEIQRQIDAIEQVPDQLVRTSDGSYFSPKQQQLMELRQQQMDLAKNYDKQVKDIQDRAEKAAVADMALNTIYLPLTNMYAYGKLYSRGFKVKKDLAGKVTKGLTETAEEGGEKAVKKEIKEKAIDIAARQEAEKQALGDRIKKSAKEYITNPVTRKKATIRGLKTGLSEGMEEINQSMFSSYSGASYSPDSPDAYYQALTNEDYQIKTKDQLTAMTQAMMDSWGNPSTYKEGLVGFMTGILGMPTFGRVNNSDENTYLGKNKAIGLSGGLLGEISRANRLNREAEVAASAMNKLVKKTDDIERFFVRSQSFTDPMEGYSKEGNKFEFENASDNDLFNAIDAFARTGRLSDLRDLVGESFGDIDNLSVEDLKDIAEKTKGDTNEWNNSDGTSMADKPETRPKMKKILKEKQQKILDAIDSYENSLEKVRTISNNSLDTDQVAELAWLDWKIKQFENRYKDIKSDNEELFKTMSNALLDYRDELTPDPGYESDLTDEEINDNISKLQKQLENSDLTKQEREEINDQIESLRLTKAAKVELSNTNNLIKFISALQKAKTPAALSALIESNPQIVKYLLGKEGQSPREAYDMFGDKLGISFEQNKKAMDELADTAKLSVAYRDFNDRFKEFSSDPIKLIDNRKEIDKKNDKNNKAKSKAKGIDRLNNMSTSEIAEGLRNGEIDAEAAEKAIEGIDLNSLEDRGEPNAAQKLDQAKKINQAYENAVASIEDQLQEGTIDEQLATDTLNALEQQLSMAESVEELLDAQGEAFLDPENIDTSDLEEADLDSIEDEIARRQAEMQSLINKISQDAIEAAEAMQDGPMPEDLPGADDIESALDGNTGHDAVDKAKSENHRKEDKQNNPTKDNMVRSPFQLATAAVEHTDVIPEQKQGIVNILTKIGEGIDSLLKNGVDEKTMAESVKSWNSYAMLQALVGDEETTALLNEYVQLRRKYSIEGSDQKQESNSPQTNKSEIDAPTPEVTQDDIEKQIRVESRRDLTQGAANDPSPIYNYWKPTITELPIHRERGSNTPYWELAKTMKKEGTNDPLYTDAQKKRMEAVGKYLQKYGAFSRINSGKVHEGDKIIFITDKTLNEEAGEMVILMAIEDKGVVHIIGDLPSKNDSIAQKQSGLPTYIEECEKYLASNKSEDRTIILPGETTVRQNMVGKVMYTPKNETHTLNEIHGDQSFKLGVAVTDGRMPIIRMKPGGTRVQGQTEEESRIISPLDSTVGQPFLLMPTSSPKRSYVCVPFFMPKYSEQTKDSSLGKAITNVLQQISSGSTDTDSVKIKNELGELISVAKSEKGFPEIHINYNGDNVKVTIKPLGSDHQVTLYNGNKNNDKMVENIQSKLYGVPFQINRKYINKDYKGQDYNRMVGELAQTNVAVGETHTRSDWFTVNPLGANLEKQKGSKIKSTKQNPKAVTPASASGATPTSIPVTTKTGNVFYVDPSDWTVYYNGKQFTGNKPGVNKARAIAFGKLNNEDMTKPYDTQWGYYNPVTGEFEQRPDNSQPQEDNIVQFPFDNNLYSVNTDTWQVLDQDNKEYNGPSLNIIRAQVYGKAHELQMDKPYETPWGVFDPVAQSFNNNNETFQVGDVITIVNYDEKGNETHRGQGKVQKVFDNGGIEIENGVQYSAQMVNKFFGKVKPFTQGAHTVITHNSRLGEAIPYTNNNKPQTTTQNTPQELKDKAKKVGLLNNKNRKALWEVLTTEQKQKLVDTLGPKQRQLIQALDQAFDASSNTFNEDALGGSVDQLLNKKSLFSKVGSRDFGKKWNPKKELAKMQKMLPQFRKDDLIIIQKGLIRIADSQNPGLAYGMFQRGVITISDVAASGTVYHEAFHAVFNSLMSVDEREKIMDAAASLYGNDKTYLVLEENLAEDFRKYVQMREAQEDEMREKYAGRPLLGKIMRFFRKLKHLCGTLRGREPYINKVFKDIYNGRYARRKVQRYSQEIRYMNEQYTPEMRDILKNAPRNSEGKLLAPNGKVSKLTERQYAHVRTKAFIDWFGDWKNDPENASKVIDDKGEDATFEPLVVYHYTDDVNLNEFRPDFDNYFTKEGGTKNAFFFTEDKVEPGSENNFLTSRKRRIDVFLNIRDLEEHQGTKEDLHKKGTTYRQVVNESAKRNPKTGGLHFSGFDDNRKENQDIWIIHNPNQVKSATDNVGTYSRENNDIRYRGVESNSQPWYLAEHVLTESEYNDLLWEMNLSEDKFSSFIHNFVKNILLVNPKQKLNKENNISFIREKLRVGNVVSENDMQKINSFTYRLLGYYPYLPTEEVSRDEYKEIITNELNNWEQNLIDSINNPPLEWNVLQRRNVVNELQDEVNKLRSQLRKETNPKERSKLGFKIHNNYRKLVEAQNELRAAEIRNNTKILASKNRLVALKLIPNIKQIALERIMREYDSRNLSEEQYNKQIESIRPLYNSLLNADRVSRNTIEAVQPYANSEHKEITFNEVEAKILESNPEFKELLQLIKKINPNVKIVVGADEYIKNQKGLGASAAGGYSPSNNTIYYRRSADVYTYIHELTHSATIYGIYNVDSADKRGFKENEFYKSINSFMDYVRDYIRQKGLDADKYTIHDRSILGLGGPSIYGFTNAGEFLAEVFANTGLQQLLENIPAMQPKKFKSLLHQIWDSIINFFSNITGINRKNVTALDQAKKLGYAAMSLTQQRINTVLEQLKELDKNNIEEETHKDVRYSRVEVIEGLEYKNQELNRQAKEINRQMKIAKDNAQNWHTINKEKWAYLSTAGYLSEDAAEDAIPDDMKLVAEVREQYGRYYIKYNTDRVLAKIRALHSEIRWNSWYITNLKQRETPFLQDNELSERMLEEQQEREDRQDYLADIAEIRQYHSDKLMYENLSQEDKDYIAQRKITLDEYNRMSDIEKRTLFECKA